MLERLRLGFKPHVPVVLQTEAAECGLACLAMVAGFYGHHVDLGSLRRRFAISLKGASLASLIDIADRLQMASRPLRVEIESLRRLMRPCILHWNFNHFVVLKDLSRRGATIHDPASGARRVPLEELSDSFTGVALELWPKPAFEPKDERQAVKLRELTGPITGLYSALGQIVLLALVLELFALLSPQLLQWLIDHVLLSADESLLQTLAVGFALLVLAQQAVSALRAWIILHVGARLSLQWNNSVLDHLLRLPLSYFERRHLGDTISRFRSIDTIRNGMTTAFVESIIDGIMGMTVLVLLYIYSPTLTALCASAVMLYAAVRWLAYGAEHQATEELIVHAAKQESHFLETARGIRAIKLFQGRDERRCRWLALLTNQINSNLLTEKLRILHRVANGLIFGAENIVTLWLGATLVLDGRLSVGMLMAYLAYKNQFSSRLGALIDKLMQLKMLRLHGQRLADIVNSEAEPGEPRGRLLSAELGPTAAAIELRGLRFRYAEHEPYVLDGIDLRIAAGESVAFVGTTGCGKSTLLHLLLGILKPTSGEIFVGGIKLTELTAPSLRRKIGAVLQNDTLFAGTIADNICFFDGQADQQRIENCAKRVAVHAEIAAMAMAYNTLVGDFGNVLSGGQQQRILLARALYRQPEILILDEATSHLDIATEARVGAALRALRMTRILVAHRPNTIRSADRVVMLKTGRVAQDRRIDPPPDHRRLTA